ncbi:MAG: cupredoxin domain-containing protein [Sulfuricella sp.]|nr:cupredoxin domain-containing protein [Sulfuricella sp.]
MNFWHFCSSTRNIAATVVTLAALLIQPLAALAEDLPTFKLTAKNGRFYPETIEAPAGVKFRIAITNEGPGAEEFESLELRKETVLAPGVTRTLVFAPMKAGTYKFFGEFHLDTAKGQIVVK